MPGVFFERDLESLGEVSLKDVSGDDVVADSAHSIQVAAMSERRAESDLLGMLEPEHRI